MKQIHCTGAKLILQLCNITQQTDDVFSMFFQRPNNVLTLEQRSLTFFNFALSLEFLIFTENFSLKVPYRVPYYIGNFELFAP